MYRVAKARLDEEEDICDAIQETMIIIYKQIKKLKNNSYFKTWSIKILINECNKIYKKKYKHILLFHKSIENESHSIENIEDKLDFEQVLNQLNYEEKLLITLYYNSQFSIKEIAEILKININTIKSKLLRTKNKIREVMKDER